MSKDLRVAIATSPRWGGHHGLSLLSPILLTVFALAGLVVTRDWRVGVGAVVLAAWSALEVRERRSITRSPAHLVLEGDRLIIPLRRRGAWIERTIALHDVVEVTAFESPAAGGIQNIVLFRASPQGGLIGLGAIPSGWFRWEGIETSAFYATLQSRVTQAKNLAAAP